MDFSLVQRSLAGLEQRFNDLHDSALKDQEEAESRLSDLESQLIVLSQEKSVLEEEKTAAKVQLSELESKLACLFKEKESAIRKNHDSELRLEQALKAFSESELNASVSSQETELALLQLHQVQTELQVCFAHRRYQSKLLSEFDALFRKMISLLIANT